MSQLTKDLQAQLKLERCVLSRSSSFGTRSSLANMRWPGRPCSVALQTKGHRVAEGACNETADGFGFGFYWVCLVSGEPGQQQREQPTFLRRE